MSQQPWRSLAAYGIRDFPRLFDRLKWISRRIGFRNELYDFLAHFASVYPKCRFVQVGAYDGLANDPIREFVIRNDWTGGFLEPVPEVFHKLKRNYAPYNGSGRLKFSNSALCPVNMEPRLWKVNPGYPGRLPVWANQLSSLSKEHLLNNLMGFPNVEKWITSVEVESVNLSVLLTQWDLEELDLLHLDIEGAEYQVLSSPVFDDLRPAVIVYEYVHLGEQNDVLSELLKGRGYTTKYYQHDALAIHDSCQLLC